jgi:hypothetical protein
VASRASAAPGRLGLHHLGGRVISCRPLASQLRAKRFGPAADRPSLPVDHAMTGDGKHPRPERSLVTDKAAQAVDNRQPAVGGQVLGCRGRRHPQIPQYRRVQNGGDAVAKVAITP